MGTVTGANKSIIGAADVSKSAKDDDAMRDEVRCVAVAARKQLISGHACTECSREAARGTVPTSTAARCKDTAFMVTGCD